MPLVRTFLAVHFPAATVAALARCVEALRRPCAQAGLDVGWVRQENLHLTLKFLGSIEEEAIAAVAEAAGAAARGLVPPLLAARGLGALPSPARPRVIYAGISGADGGPPAGLLALQAAVEQALEALGHPREARPFTPHLTLGRVRGFKGPRGGEGGLAALLLPHAGQGFGEPAPAAEIVVNESRPSRSGGVEYVPRARLPIGEKRL